MSGLRTLGDALALLAEYEAAPARERNCHRAIWAGRLAVALGDVLAELADGGGRVVGEAYDKGADRFAYDLGCCWPTCAAPGGMTPSGYALPRT